MVTNNYITAPFLLQYLNIISKNTGGFFIDLKVKGNPFYQDLYFIDAFQLVKHKYELI